MYARYSSILGCSLLLLFPVSPIQNAPIVIGADPEIALTHYPKDYFGPPVDNSIRLTGTFGELRPDHFHAGIDIKSKNGRAGDPIYAAAEGYIERIRIQAGGYGNVLQIAHPNGFSTLYAHLDRFAPELQAYVRKLQYEQETFELDLRPDATAFPIQRGALIGYMGNTGHSFGPHLHFEIRHTTTDKALNPQLFGFPVADDIAPELRDMKVYFLNGNSEPALVKPFPIAKRPDGAYAAHQDTVRLQAEWVGFGLKATDQLNGLRNDNGIHTLSLYADDLLQYRWQMDELDFDETRYINAHTDYQTRRKSGGWYHRCFVLPGDRLSNYMRTPSRGAVWLDPVRPVKITIKAADAAGNTSTLSFWALRDTVLEPLPVPEYDFLLPHDAASRLDLENLQVSFPDGTFYTTVPFRYHAAAATSKNAYSKVHHLHDASVPVHQNFEIRIRPEGLPKELRSKAVIAQLNGGRPDTHAGQWQGEWLVAQARSFGAYCLMTDVTPPTITPVGFSADMRRKSRLAFRIRDNFTHTNQTNGLHYRATIDGKWKLFKHDRKRALIYCDFEEENITRGAHRLKLVVTDDRGNAATFEKVFKR